MSGHEACFLQGPMANEVRTYPQEKPHERIVFPKPMQSVLWSLEPSDEVMVGRVVYRYLGPSRKVPRLHYYEHVEG
jgi:hypothetical protein